MKQFFRRAPHRPTEGGLGTFIGVFTPTLLTILGVIMYLRFGWVVGNVGLAKTLLIVTLATAITFLTALSIAAIATDQTVRTGGAYYMISRSLGVETGGAVGIPLYLAQGLSVALYTVGFAESVVAVVPALDQRVVGLVTTVVVAILALTSARTAIRVQYVIMGAIGLGWQGPGNLKQFLALDNVQVVAVCDIDQDHLALAKKMVDGNYDNSDCATYANFEDIIARNDLDAVMIALPDHWHAIPAIAAIWILLFSFSPTLGSALLIALVLFFMRKSRWGSDSA